MYTYHLKFASLLLLACSVVCNAQDKPAAAPADASPATTQKQEAPKNRVHTPEEVNGRMPKPAKVATPATPSAAPVVTTEENAQMEMVRLSQENISLRQQIVQLQTQLLQDRIGSHNPNYHWENVSNGSKALVPNGEPAAKAPEPAKK